MGVVKLFALTRTVLLFALLKYVSSNDKKNCPASTLTVEYVERCPTSEAEVKQASRLKKCDLHAKNQTCTTPENFKFHCVVNTFLNETISVCAPQLFIKGSCAEYNAVGERIQDLYAAPCSNHSPPCPDLYISTDAYKYRSCYELVYNNRKIISTSPKPENITTDNRSSDPETNVGLVIGITIPLVVVFFISVVLYYKRCRRAQGHATIEEPRKIDTISHGNGDQGNNEEYLETTTLLEEEDKPGAMKKMSKSTLTDKTLVVLPKDDETLSEENLEDTRKYLREYKVIDKYYIETGMYRDTETLIKKNAIVIITGPPGSGKTNAAVHLMLKEMYSGWDLRKISTFSEFSFLARMKNTVFFIDNFFCDDSNSGELNNWWEELDNVFEKRVKPCKGQNGTYVDQKVHILVTARENVVEKACQHMKRTTPIFNDDFRICVYTKKPDHSKGSCKQCWLTDDEKTLIIKRQLEMAKEVLKIDCKDLDETFLKEVKGVESPIGFPLCAHLYACKEEYRKKGLHFFSHPTDILRAEVKNEIESDKKNRTKTLFLLIFLFECHLKKHEHEKLNIEDENKCKQFLDKISKDLMEQFHPLDFTDLGGIAKKLTGAFFLEMGHGTLRFTYDSVFEAVGAYFCERHFKQVVRQFPLHVIENHEYKSLTDEENRLLSLRLLYEIFHSELSKACSFSVFKLDSFTNAFYKELCKRDDDSIRCFFNVTDESSKDKLPITFWASRYRLYNLSSKLLKLVQKKNLDYDHHLYLMLLGECCANDAEFLGTIDMAHCRTKEEIWKKVMDFKWKREGSLIHVIVQSSRRDEDVSDIVKSLRSHGNIKEIVNKRDKSNQTPIMLAVKCEQSRSMTIDELMHSCAEMNLKDSKSATVLHHCIQSDNNDDVCAEYLQRLLRLSNRLNINSDNIDGDSALNLAAKHSHCSRILSILELLQCSKIDVETLDADGCSPIHNCIIHLCGSDPLNDLERCTRVAIFIIYGVDPQENSDEGENPESLCEAKGLGNTRAILASQKDQNIMARVLKGLLDTLEQQQQSKNLPKRIIQIPNPQNEMIEEVNTAIQKAVNILRNVKFGAKKETKKETTDTPNYLIEL